VPDDDEDEAPRRRGLLGDPRNLSEIGDEPDVRFTLANERTMLAWLRTALALGAAGLGATEFLDSQPPLARAAVGVPLVALAVVTAAVAYRRWERDERSMRLHEPLRYDRFPQILALSIAAIVLVGLILAIVHL
jgi:putative membrane protein